MKEKEGSVAKRFVGVMAGYAVGFALAIMLDRTGIFSHEYTAVVIGFPLAIIFARAYGGPLQFETLGKDQKSTMRKVMWVLLVTALLGSVTFGIMSDDIVSGLGMSVAIIVSLGHGWGMLIDERMGQVFNKACTNAFVVFSLGTAYVGFYMLPETPELVSASTFLMVAWISWAALLVSWVYYYLIKGE